MANKRNADQQRPQADFEAVAGRLNGVDHQVVND
jgi:hypothetical protein